MTAREDLIGYALVALPNEPAFAKCEELADAYRAEVRAEAAADVRRAELPTFPVGERADLVAKMMRAVDARIAERGAAMTDPLSRFSATPAEVDRHLRTILCEDTYLNYQRAIGNRAVAEAAEDIRREAHSPLAGEKFTNGMTFAADHIDQATGGGPYPSVLVCSRHKGLGGFGPCPGAPRCTPGNSDGGELR